MKININKKDIETFDKSDIGKTKNAFLKRAQIIGIILIMFGILSILLDIMNDTQSTINYILAITTTLFGIFFILYSIRIKKKEVNKYIHSKKSSK